MELRQLKYVEAVARHRHFTRAAEELHVAQSALSHQVRRLEAELGTELFERTSRRVVTTEVGEAVATRARRVLAEVDGVDEDVAAIHGLVRGRISVGALLPAGEIDVPAMLARFREAHPGIEVNLREGTLGDMLGHLAEERVDAAFAMLDVEPPDGMEVEPLSEDEVVAAFTPGEAPGLGRIVPEDLAGYPMVVPGPSSSVKRSVDAAFERDGETLQVTLESGDPFLLRCLVSSGFGAGIIPRSLTRREGPPIELRGFDPPIRIPVTLMWREDRHVPAAARAFIDFVRAAAPAGRHAS